MSLEAKIEALTAAVTQLTAILINQTVAPSPLVAAPLAPIAPPAPVAPAPNFLSGLPTPAAAAPAAAPFNTAGGMIDYVTIAYQTLGAVKGARLQEVFNNLNVGNVSDIKPEQYAALYQGVEALKAS